MADPKQKVLFRSLDPDQPVEEITGLAVKGSIRGVKFKDGEYETTDLELIHALEDHANQIGLFTSQPRKEK